MTIFKRGYLQISYNLWALICSHKPLQDYPPLCRRFFIFSQDACGCMPGQINGNRTDSPNLDLSTLCCTQWIDKSLPQPLDMLMAIQEFHCIIFVRTLLAITIPTKNLKTVSFSIPLPRGKTTFENYPFSWRSSSVFYLSFFPSCHGFLHPALSKEQGNPLSREKWADRKSCQTCPLRNSCTTIPCPPKYSCPPHVFKQRPEPLKPRRI